MQASLAMHYLMHTSMLILLLNAPSLGLPDTICGLQGTHWEPSLSRIGTGGGEDERAPSMCLILVNKDGLSVKGLMMMGKEKM